MWQAGEDGDPPQPPPRDRVWLHVLLLILTFGTATYAGTGFYLNYLTDVGIRRVNVTLVTTLIGGLWYSVPALLILGCHEMGHYLACRYYGINASLPYFIPVPSTFGTLGAVIRIRDPLRTKRILFDVGVAGPLAGFAVLLPAMILGIQWSRLTRVPPRGFEGFDLGEPMVFQLVSRWLLGPIPEGYQLNAHPMAFASIFGLLATALNLLPIGQLDGGHLSYANFGPRAKYVTYATLATTLVLGLTVATSWLIWGVVILILLFLTGFEHPPTADEHEPLDRRRVAVTILAVIIFALCFTPWPITPTELISR